MDIVPDALVIETPSPFAVEDPRPKYSKIMSRVLVPMLTAHTAFNKLLPDNPLTEDFEKLRNAVKDICRDLMPKPTAHAKKSQKTKNKEVQ